MPHGPVWDQFAALIPRRPERAHPLGCHRPRIPDRIVFGYVVAALVHGSGYERIAEDGCSDRTIRRRVREWADAGLAEKLFALALAAYDKMIGLDLSDVAVDGCITKAPCGGEAAGPSPVDRRKQGLKRSTATDAAGVPLHVVCAGAHRHDAPLLGPTLAGAFDRVDPPPDAAVHLDRRVRRCPQSRRAGRSGRDWRHRPQRRPCPDPGGPPLGHRAHARMHACVRQATPLHRETQGDRRLLPLPGRRVRHGPLSHPRSPHSLPLAGETNHP